MCGRVLAGTGWNRLWQGAERIVHRFAEIDAGGSLAGERLVAKQTRFEELVHQNDFHTTFCRVQGEAQDLARRFNRRVSGPRGWAVTFLQCWVYHVRDPKTRRIARFLVELVGPSRLGRPLPAGRPAGR